MSANTTIEWCDFSFNIVWGCAKKSPGCENCYALSEAKRRGFPSIWGTERMGATRRTFGDAHWAEPLRWNRRAKREGVRRRVFCSSMADWCDPHPTTRAQLPRLFELIRQTECLDWLLLTKNPEHFAETLPADFSAAAYPNVWLGVSCENQKYADERIPLLVRQDAAVRFLSCEPLLGPIEFSRLHQHCPEHDFPGGRCTEWHEGVRTVDWVIVGGESGPKARLLNLEWVTDLVAQCDFAGVACFVKQLGARPHSILHRISHRGDTAKKPDGFYRFLNDRKGGDMAEWPEELRVREFPKVPA